MSKEINKIFYHYTSIDGLYGIIENKCLHATHIDYLNDPSEEEYFNTTIKYYLDKNEVANNTYSILYNNSYESTYDSYEKYIISFSDHPDSLPMWNHYSKGNGYNLGFRIDNIINRTKGLRNFYYHKIKIIYDETDQLDILSKFFNKHGKAAVECNQLSIQMEEYENQNREDLYQSSSSEQSELIISFMEDYSILKKMFKHPSYSNEREVRLIVELIEQYDMIHYRKSNHGLIIPFVKIPIVLNEDLVSITLHPLQKDIGINGIRHFLRNKKIDLKENITISKIPYREV